MRLIYIRRREHRAGRLELSNIIMANTVGILIVFAGFFLVLSYTEEAKNFSRSMFAYFYIFNIVLEEVERLVVRGFYVA